MEFRPKLYYFNIAGRAECIRLLLKHAKVEFEDIRYEFSEWPQHKEKFEYHQMPALEIGEGVMLTQTAAILAYLGVKYGYFDPTDADKSYRIANFGGGIQDCAMKMVPIMYGDAPEEKKKEMATAFATTDFPFFMSIFEKKIKENVSQDFLVGDKLTTLDFAIFGFVKSMIKGGGMKDLLEPQLKNYPTFEAYVNKWFQEFYG